MRFNKTFAVLVFGAALTACSSMSNGPTSSSFTNTVASSDQFEIQSSKLALTKSHNKKVRQVANQMIADHTKSGGQMNAVLTANNLPLPTPHLSQMHQQKLDMLAGLRGHDFDTQYLNAQDQAHMDAISLFETYARTGDNVSLQQFAKNTLPTLHHHYELIEQAEGR